MGSRRGPRITKNSRHDRGPTFVIVGNPTLADAIVERVVHNAHRIELSEEGDTKAARRGSIPTSTP